MCQSREEGGFAERGGMCAWRQRQTIMNTKLRRYQRRAKGTGRRINGISAQEDELKGVVVLRLTPGSDVSHLYLPTAQWAIILPCFCLICKKTPFQVECITCTINHHGREGGGVIKGHKGMVYHFFKGLIIELLNTWQS